MTASMEYYEQSYPPSLWAGGATPPVSNPATGVTTGAPGSFTPSGADVPASLAALTALGALGQTTAWASAGDHVLLGDASKAYWDGAAWAAGVVGTPADEPEDDPCDRVPNGGASKRDLVDFIEVNFGHDLADGALNELTKDELREFIAAHCN